MRKPWRRLVMAGALAAAGCQNKCTPDCVLGTNQPLASGAPSAAPLGDPASCGGVSGLNLGIGSSLHQTFTINTDANGRVTLPNWRLGLSPGPNTIRASVDGAPLNAAISGSPVTFTVTGTAPAAVTMVAGNNPNGQIASLPTARLTDVNLNPVAGVSVTFAVAGGGGGITGATAVTDALGRATVGSWRLGPAPGASTLSATAAPPNITGSPLTFTATGQPGAGAPPR